MIILKKIEKIIAFILIRSISLFRPRLGTKISVFFYRKWGMQIIGFPNYISSTAWFDGSDYSKIILGNGVTISSYTSFLTHDWALHTVGNSLNIINKKPFGIQKGIKIGDHVFIGRNSILLPGSEVGKGSIIGAGSVVRGKVPAYSIVIGNPMQIIGDSKKYFKSKITFLD